MTSTTNATSRQYRDTPVDAKPVLSALWIAMLLVFAYVDIFGFHRADVLGAAIVRTAWAWPAPVTGR